MNLARDTKIDVSGMCLYQILVWKQHNPVQFKFITEAYIKTVPSLYRIGLPRTAGISTIVKVTLMWITCYFTGAGHRYILWAGVNWLKNICHKMERTKQPYVFLFFFWGGLPAYIQYKVADKYFCIVMGFLEFKNICTGSFLLFWCCGNS